MTTWKDVEEAVPEFAERVRKIFDAHKHKTIATLRANGAPRISGIEAEFVDGELTFGSMTGARKGADLHRDPGSPSTARRWTRRRETRPAGPATRRSPGARSRPGR
jgi:hypothetical protein